jgi:hypothetical protein
MFKFIFFLFFFGLLLTLLMGFSVLRTIRNVIFGNPEPKRTTRQQQQHQTTQKKTTRKKIFTKDEGEYIDYEEVK